jgi:hypothetical protein
VIQTQLKLRVKRKQEAILSTCLLILTRVWNWAIRKIELVAKDMRYYKKQQRATTNFDRCFTANTLQAVGSLSKWTANIPP